MPPNSSNSLLIYSCQADFPFFITKYGKCRIAGTLRTAYFCVMKNLKIETRQKLLLTGIVGFLLLMSGCIKKEDVAPPCDKNTTLKIQGEDRCGNAMIREHTQDNITGEYILIGISYGGGWIEVDARSTLLGQTELQEGTTYQANMGGASFSFPNLNKVNSGSFTITKLDKTNKLISGEFSFDAEGVSNYQTYPFSASGKFTNVSIQ